MRESGVEIERGYNRGNLEKMIGEQLITVSGSGEQNHTDIRCSSGLLLTLQWLVITCRVKVQVPYLYVRGTHWSDPGTLQCLAWEHALPPV